MIAIALATVALVAGVASGTTAALETADSVESSSSSPSPSLSIPIVTDAATGEDPTCSFPVTVTDDSGTEVTPDDEPESVVTLADLEADPDVLAFQANCLGDVLEGSEVGAATGRASRIVIGERVELEPEHDSRDFGRELSSRIFVN